MEQSKYDWILNNQDIHWWFVGRNKVIDRYIQKIGLTKNNTRRILDISIGFGAPITIVKTMALMIRSNLLRIVIQ